MKSLLFSNPVTRIRQTLVVAVLILSVQYGSAQARAQADVSVTNVSIAAVRSRPTVVTEIPSSTQQPGAKTRPAPTAGDVLKCSITVFSHNDDDANQAMLVVVVPVEVSIVSSPSNAVVYKAGGGASPFAGYLVFSLGDMGVGQSITVEFTFTKSAYGNKVGAYAYSASPDPNPANNYKDATY